MKLLKRKDIDDQKWNDCILHSPNGLIYGLTWFLDKLIDTWQGLVWEENNCYIAVFPVPIRKKFALKYVYPPFFIQQLGLFSKSKLFNHQEAEALNLLESSFRFIELNLNYQSVKGEERKNLTLLLGGEYDEIKKGYSKNHIRNLNKANKSGFKIEHNLNAEKIISLFKKDRGADLKTYSDRDYEKFNSLYLQAEKESKAFTIGLSLNGRVACGGVFLKYKNRITFIFSGNTSLGKNSSALFYLIDYVIQKYAKSGFIFDFEGSQNEGVSRFYCGFGAKEENYKFYKHNNLPIFLRRFKK